MATKGVHDPDGPKIEAEDLTLPSIMKFFTFYYLFRMTLLDICYLTLGDLPALQILIPLTMEGVFIVIVCISAKLTNVFGSRFVIFRLVLQGVSIFMWLLMSYFGTMKSIKYDYRGFREIEYEQALPHYVSLVMEWITVFLILAMLTTEVVWSLNKIYRSLQQKVKDQMAKFKRKKERKLRKKMRESVQQALIKPKLDNDNYFNADAPKKRKSV
jgi:hypothetical protein